MAFSSYRTRFQGTLANVSIEELKELDFNKETLKERLEYINKKHERVKSFYDTYIYTADEEDDTATEDEKREYYKVNLNTTDELSSEINIFKYLEADGNYILNSLDIPRDKQQQYRILSEEDFKKLLAREKSLTVLEAQEQTEDNTMDILASKETNDYTNMNHRITKRDLEDPRTAKVLRVYETAREHLKEEMVKCKNKESQMSLYEIKKMLQTINDDMILSKIQLQGIRSPAKKLGDIGSCPNFGCVDYSNKKHIKQILRLVRFGELQPDSMLSHLAYDMQVALKALHKEGKLTDIDIEVADCYNAGMSNIEVAKELNVTEGAIRKRLEKIFKHISTYYKDDAETVEKIHIIKNKKNQK